MLKSEHKSNKILIALALISVLLLCSGCKKNSKKSADGNSYNSDSISVSQSDFKTSESIAEESSSEQNTVSGGKRSGNKSVSGPSAKTTPKDVDTAQDIFDDSNSKTESPSKSESPSESGNSSKDDTSGKNTPSEDENNKSDGEYSKRY